MEKINILPTTIYKYDIPNNIYDSTIKLIEKMNVDNSLNRGNEAHFGKSTFGEKSLHRQNKWKFLCNFINPKLKEVANEVGYSHFEDIKVSLMWVNKSFEKQWHHAHEHPWSILSGIIYLEGESGNTWFSRRSDYSLGTRLTLFDKTGKEINEENIHVHEPINKTMIIFPSLLRHSVSENFSTKPRVTISFNSFFSGTISNETMLSGLTIEVL